MTNFELKIPTEILFGKKREEEIGKILKRDGVTNVLLIYGTSSIKSTGLYNHVVNFLNDSKIKFVEYSGIKSNPLVSDVNKATNFGIEHRVDAILAVGGGSVMDSAKGIAASIYHKSNVWDFFNGTQIKGALPIYNIVTLAATGSEMNSSFVLTNDDTKEKFGMGSEYCYPKVSILNPELTFTVPPNYTAYSAIDIFSHIIEGYLTSTYISGLTCRLKESLIKTVIESTETILINPQDYDGRAEFMWAAVLALHDTTTQGTEGANLPNHMIEHAVSGVHNIPHGAGLSIIIPAWMKWYKDKNQKQFLRFSKEIFNKNSIDEGIEALEKWFHSLGSPIRFSEYNINETSFDDITDRAYSQGEKWGISKIYTKDAIREILELAKE